MRLHSNAATTHVTRRQIQEAEGSYRGIARRFGTSVSTIYKWKNRSGVEDASSAPKHMKTAFDPETAEFLLELRRRLLSLDEIFESVMDAMPKLARSSLWRLFKRSGLGRLKRYQKPPSSEFKVYPPGYVHIDHFQAPRLGGKRHYCFVAVDRATRRTHVALFDNKTQATGAEFLRQCAAAFEFKIQIVLTDNGSEFSNRAYNGHYGKAKGQHAFDILCLELGIRHRFTKPRTPKTNGLVERQNSIIKNATVRIHTYLSTQAMEKDLLDWNERNNRKRQRRLNYKSPLKVSAEWYNADASLFQRVPEQMAA